MLALVSLHRGWRSLGYRRLGQFAAWATLLAAVPGAGSCGDRMPSQTGDLRPQPQIKAAPPTPIAEKKVELDGYDPWKPAWTVLIEESLPHQLLSKRRARAVRALCPRYRTMTLANRRAFWAYFFQALAGAEAGLKPTANVRHDEPQVAIVDPVTHHIIRQEGLLQLAYADRLRYGCDFDWEKDRNLPQDDPAKTILNPRNNLLCGMKILYNQLITQHKPLLSNSSYWVTLRPGHPSFQVFLKQMANVPEACGSPLRKERNEEPALPASSEADAAIPARRHTAAEPADKKSVVADPQAGPSAAPR